MNFRVYSLVALAAMASLGGCSFLQNDKIDYKSSTRVPTLEVPPDLTALSRDSRFVVPGSSVTASGFAASQGQTGVPTAANTIADARIERQGNQRYLVIARPADQVWSIVRDFWQDNGFLLTQDRQDIGIMETDWAENRAKLPQDFVRNSIGKVFDSLYDTGERDKFRTRLERTASGTEIYITHRGLTEKVTSGPNAQSSTAWEQRSADPELEIEMLRRLMVKLGVAQDQAKTLSASANIPAPKTSSRVANVNGTPVVLVDDGFDRAWRRVGLSLDRTGFTVEDRDRAQGLYFVRYVEPKADTKEPGFFAKILGAGSGAAVPPVKYRIAVRSQGESTTVSVLNASGAPEASDNAQRIVKVLADDLR